jgi:hypothetical protein
MSQVVVCLDGGGALYASPALSNDNSRVYVACYNAGMFGLNRMTGAIDWTTALKNVMSSPAVVRAWARWGGLGWAGVGWGWVGLGWAGVGWGGLGWAGVGWGGLGWAGVGLGKEKWPCVAPVV